jgi:hypothetical protein
MNTLAIAERDLYETVWGFEQYATNAPGAWYAEMFLEMAGIEHPHQHVVLDAGCGSGKGGMALLAKGFRDVRLCDLTSAGLVDDAKALPFHEACLWEPLAPQLGYLHGGAADYVYCCDVLEHIPTPFVMLVVARLLEVCVRGAFFSVALRADEYGAFVGRPLHQTVEGFVWWRDNLSALGVMRECRDLGANGVYMLERRRV